MTAVLDFLKSHEKACLALSLAVFGGYLTARQWSKEKTEKNLLQTSLQELIKKAKHPKINKIVITADPSQQGNFRRNLVSYIKTRLIEEKVKVLINCSPQKLLNSGCECFLESMEQNDSEYPSFYENALKAQYLIEDTIVSIETINEGKGPIVMICDNNPMDIRLMNDSDTLWEETLSRNNITESEIREGYDLIIHTLDHPRLTPLDHRITAIWGHHPHYHQVLQQDGNLRDKCEEVYQLLTAHLEKAKEKALS